MNSVARRGAEHAPSRLGRARPHATYDFGRMREEDRLVPAGDAEASLSWLRGELRPGLVTFVGTCRWLDGGDTLAVGRDEREEARPLEKSEKGIAETGHVYLCWS